MRELAKQDVRFLPLYEKGLAWQLAELERMCAVDFSVHFSTRLAGVKREA